MRESRTVGWNSLTGEFQFVADDPGPLLLVTPEQLDAAIMQRDGTWLLIGYTQPDHSEWCEFVVRTPVMQLARSLLPHSYGPVGATQTTVEEPSRAPTGQLNWQPAPPTPAAAQTSPVSFYQPRSDPAEITQVVDLNWEAQPPLTPELYDDLPEREEKQSYSGDENWIVRYVLTDPRVADETERQMEVRADSDAGALRALHAAMQRESGEPSYRVVAVLPTSQAYLAA